MKWLTSNNIIRKIVIMIVVVTILLNSIVPNTSNAGLIAEGLDYARWGNSKTFGMDISYFSGCFIWNSNRNGFRKGCTHNRMY